MGHWEVNSERVDCFTKPDLAVPIVAVIADPKVLGSYLLNDLMLNMT